VKLPGSGGRRWVSLVKVLVSAAVFGFLLSRIPLSRLGELFGSLRWEYLAGALTILTGSVFLGSFQWGLLLKAQEVFIPYSQVVRFYYVGLFFNNFLPANVGADVSRSYQAIQYGGRKREVVSATIMDRVVGLLMLCMVAVLFSILFMNRYESSAYFAPVLSFLFLCIMVLAALLNRSVLRLLEKPFELLRAAELAGRVHRLCDSLHLLARKRTLLSQVGILAFLIQVLRVAVHILVARSLGIGIPPAYFFFFVPVIAIAAALPVSINGIGVREGVGIIMFSSVGVPADQAFAMQFLAYIIMVVVSAVGGVLFLMPARGPAAEAVPGNRMRPDGGA